MKTKFIVLLPLLLLFTRRPPEERTGLLEVLFGPRENPGILREAVMMIRNTSQAVARVSGVINLSRALADHGERGIPGWRRWYTAASAPSPRAALAWSSVRGC